MKRKKMFGIGAAVIMVTLTVSPIVTSEKNNNFDDDFMLAITEFIEINRKDLVTLGSYLEYLISSYNFGQSVPALPEELETLIDNLVTQWQQMYNKYSQSNQFQQPNFEGITAYYKSIGPAKFFNTTGDYNYYFGHCWAFDKINTFIICTIFETGSIISLLIGSLIIALIPIFGFLYGLLFIWVILPILDQVREWFKEAKSHPYGLALFYFDRVDKILRVYDKISYEKQPDHLWDPSFWYPQTNWIKNP